MKAKVDVDKEPHFGIFGHSVDCRDWVETAEKESDGKWGWDLELSS